MILIVRLARETNWARGELEAAALVSVTRIYLGSLRTRHLDLAFKGGRIGVFSCSCIQVSFLLSFFFLNGARRVGSRHGFHWDG